MANRSNHGKWDTADVDSNYNPLDSMHYHRARKRGTLPERPLGLVNGAGLSNSDVNMHSSQQRATHWKIGIYLTFLSLTR